jgi:membrane protein
MNKPQPKSLKNRIITIVKSIVQPINNLNDHYGIEMAGYMAFLSILSLFPFLVFIVGMFGFIGDMEMGKGIIRFIFDNIPKNIVEIIRPRVEEIISGPPVSILTLSIVGAIWTASSSFEGMRGVLNIIYQVKSPPNYFWRRAMSIIEFFIVCFMIIIFSLVAFILPITLDFVSSMVKDIHLADRLLTFSSDYVQQYSQIGIISAMAIMAMFIYLKIPSATIRVKEIIPGTITTVIGWFFAGDILQRYLINFNQVNLIYGSLAGMIAILLFFFMIHLIWIFGAEINFLIYGNKK